MALTKVTGNGLGAIPAISGANLTGLTAGQLPAGSVLQVVEGGRLTRVTHASTSYGDVGVSTAITPSATSSKIFIILTGTLSNGNASNHAFIRLFRGDTEIGSGTGGTNTAHRAFMGMLQSDQNYPFNGFGQTFLDSPSTTSATTYKIQVNALNGTAVLGARGDDASASIPTRLTLMEIAG
tara:strand:+ start:23 stop:565 length:543 start_codon:yes stop_codon:yes gene_type:complete